jgi:hypothetical protein
MSAAGENSDIRESFQGGDDAMRPRFQRQSVFVGEGLADARASGGQDADGDAGAAAASDSADVASAFSPEPQCNYAQFFEQFFIHVMFPFSLPFVLIRGGMVRAYNQKLMLHKSMTGQQMVEVAAFNWAQALFFWAMTYLEIAEPEKIGRLEGRVHPLYAIVLVLNIARWAMVSAKYCYLTDTEYKNVLTNPNSKTQSVDLRSLQLLTSWNEPTCVQLRQQLEVSQERLGLSVEGLQFSLESTGAKRLAAFLQPTGSLKTSDDGITLTCDSGATKLPQPHASESEAESESEDYTVKAELLLLSVYERAVSEASWSSYARKANAIAVLCALMLFPAAIIDGYYELLVAEGSGGNGNGGGGGGESSSATANVTVSALLSQHDSIFWTHRCLTATIFWLDLRVLWLWFYVALVDYRRKAHVMKRMGALIAPMLSIVNGVSTQQPVLPLSSSADVYAWLVCRRLVQNMGRMYQLRVQLLTGYVLLGLLVVIGVLVLDVLTSGQASITEEMLEALFGISAVGITLVLNFLAIAVTLVQLVTAGAEVNESAVLHSELLVACQLQMRHKHSCVVKSGGTLRSEAIVSSHDRMFDSAIQMLEVLDRREPVEVLGMRASKSMLSPLVSGEFTLTRKQKRIKERSSMSVD